MPARHQAGMSRSIAGRALRSTLGAARLCRRDSRGWLRAHPCSGRCRVHCPGTLRPLGLQRTPPLHGQNGEGRRPQKRKLPPRCLRTAGRSPQCAARGVDAAWEKKAQTRDANLNVPCADLAKERDKNLQTAEQFRRSKENDISWRGVRRRPQKIGPGEAARLRGNSTLSWRNLKLFSTRRWCSLIWARRQFPADPDCNVAGQNRHCVRVNGRRSCRLEVRLTAAAKPPLLSSACDPGMGLRQGTAYQ